MRPKGIEPPASPLGGERSIQLSYERITSTCIILYIQLKFNLSIDFFKIFYIIFYCDVLVAQLDRVFGYEPNGWRFESSRAHQNSLNFVFDEFFYCSPLPALILFIKFPYDDVSSTSCVSLSTKLTTTSISSLGTPAKD